MLTLLLLGLSIAQVALLVSMRVVVPLVLTLLSIVFGPQLRRAAARVSAAGERAGEAVGRARRFLRGDRDGWRAPPEAQPVSERPHPKRRVRVDVNETDDRAGEFAAEEEAEEAERGGRPRARR